MPFQSLLNHRFERLTVIERSTNNQSGQARWICKCVCGKITGPITTSSLTSKNTQSCGCLHRERAGHLRGKTRELHPLWKGGRHVNEDGYVNLRVDNKYRPEHHLVMEQILQRALLPEETVHHKNGVRSDNRPENLELWCSRHPKGQRVSDLVVWAKEILSRYDATSR